MIAPSASSIVACRWCGLPVGGGPACDVCGSPVLDVSGWTTVLDVSWPIEPLPTAAPTAPPPPHAWLTVGQAAAHAGVPEPVLRQWMETEGIDPAAGIDSARFLLVDPTTVTPKMLLAATSSSMERPAPAPVPFLTSMQAPVPPRVDLPVMPAPSTAPPWSAPVRLQVSLGGEWVFYPSAQARRTFRIERIRSISTATVGVAAAAKGIEFLLRQALR
jgi:hypothetical protein